MSLIGSDEFNYLDEKIDKLQEQLTAFLPLYQNYDKNFENMNSLQRELDYFKEIYSSTNINISNQLEQLNKDIANKSSNEELFENIRKIRSLISYHATTFEDLFRDLKREINEFKSNPDHKL